MVESFHPSLNKANKDPSMLACREMMRHDKDNVYKNSVSVACFRAERNRRSGVSSEESLGSDSVHIQSNVSHLLRRSSTFFLGGLSGLGIVSRSPNRS